ncbi:TPA: hypothetical protein ACQ5AB_004132 [Citrobacter freundii]
MGSNIIELAKLGHERAAELKASCGAVDVRSLAQLISDLATQPEVQFVRSTNMAVQLANAESKCRELAAENAAIKNSIPKLKDIDYGNDNMDDVSLAEDVGFNDAVTLMNRWIPDTPSTDAFLAEVRAQAIESLLTESFRADIAGALADFDGMDEQSLQTLIWSGQPPEPDGDVWCVEYMSRAAAVLRKVREFAAQLRKGAAL